MALLHVTPVQASLHTREHAHGVGSQMSHNPVAVQCADAYACPHSEMCCPLQTENGLVPQQYFDSYTNWGYLDTNICKLFWRSGIALRAIRRSHGLTKLPEGKLYKLWHHKSTTLRYGAFIRTGYPYCSLNFGNWNVCISTRYTFVALPHVCSAKKCNWILERSVSTPSQCSTNMLHFRAAFVSPVQK